jgi:hypothetical protein
MLDLKHFFFDINAWVIKAEEKAAKPTYTWFFKLIFRIDSFLMNVDASVLGGQAVFQRRAFPEG